MSEPDQIEVRVTRLETQMADVRKLARRTDFEVSGWRGVLKNHTEVLNGMGERLELFERKVDERFDKVDDRFDEVEAEMRDGFSKLKGGQTQITALLNAALKKSDET